MSKKMGKIKVYSEIVDMKGTETPMHWAQSVLDPTAIYLGGVNQKRGNNRGENV